MSARIYLPAAADIAAVFEEECIARGASAVDCHCDDRRLIARAVFGPELAVRPGDVTRGGVAIRADGPMLLVHPYTWRQVCSNGAIAAQVLGTSHAERVEVEEALVSSVYVGGALDALRAAIGHCADPARFTESVEQMRGATEVSAAIAIALLPHILRAEGNHQREVIMAVLDRQMGAADPSAYGVFNAITSLGRDSSDPERRWRLEVAGGELLRRVAAPALAHAMAREGRASFAGVN